MIIFFILFLKFLLKIWKIFLSDLRLSEKLIDVLFFYLYLFVIDFEAMMSFSPLNWKNVHGFGLYEHLNRIFKCQIWFLLDTIFLSLKYDFILHQIQRTVTGNLVNRYTTLPTVLHIYLHFLRFFADVW